MSERTDRAIQMNGNRSGEQLSPVSDHGRVLAIPPSMTSTNHDSAVVERRPLVAQTTIGEVMTASPHTIGREQKLTVRTT